MVLVLVMVVVAFSSLARSFGECSTIHSPPALFLFEVEISSRALILYFMPGSASCDDCGQVFPYKWVCGHVPG